METETLGGLIGLVIGMGTIGAYFLGRTQQQRIDHRLEQERWDDYLTRRASR